MEVIHFKLISATDLMTMPKRESQWKVVDNGMECKKFNYFIDAKRLHETSWILHIADKEWVDMRDFVLCFFAARHKHFPSMYPSKSEIYRGVGDKKGTRAERRISSSLRFQIFYRDNFCCQLCGASAKDGATLEVDHKISVHHGGSDIESNLWTLCFECNRGKGELSITDDPRREGE